MNHPTPESWMSYLYDESNAAERADLEAHLAVCGKCRDEVAQCRRTMGLLDLDEATLALPRRHARTQFRWQPVLAWSAAAAVVLCTGFLAGRQGTVSRAEFRSELAAAREQIAEEVRGHYSDDLKALAAAAVSATTQQNREALREIRNEFVEARATDQRQLLTALDRMEVQRVQDYRQLSGGLVRLARVTGSGFRQAEEQFNSLASYTPDSTPVTDLKENKP